MVGIYLVTHRRVRSRSSTDSLVSEAIGDNPDKSDVTCPTPRRNNCNAVVTYVTPPPYASLPRRRRSIASTMPPARTRVCKSEPAPPTRVLQRAVAAPLFEEKKKPIFGRPQAFRKPALNSQLSTLDPQLFRPAYRGPWAISILWYFFLVARVVRRDFASPAAIAMNSAWLFRWEASFFTVGRE